MIEFLACIVNIKGLEMRYTELCMACRPLHTDSPCEGKSFLPRKGFSIEKCLVEEKIIFVNKNAQCHTAQQLGWYVLLHPALSQNRSSPAFNLFPKRKRRMEGKRYATLKDLSLEMKVKIRSLNNEESESIEKLHQSWESVIINEGDYTVEKL